jgi:hypothetical protein
MAAHKTYLLVKRIKQAPRGKNDRRKRKRVTPNYDRGPKESKNWIPAFAGMTHGVGHSSSGSRIKSGMTGGAACQPVLKQSRKHPAHPPHKPKIIRENSCNS